MPDLEGGDRNVPLSPDWSRRYPSQMLRCLGGKGLRSLRVSGEEDDRCTLPLGSDFCNCLPRDPYLLLLW